MRRTILPLHVIGVCHMGRALVVILGARYIVDQGTLPENNWPRDRPLYVHKDPIDDFWRVSDLLSGACVISTWKGLKFHTRNAAYSALTEFLPTLPLSTITRALELGSKAHTDIESLPAIKADDICTFHCCYKNGCTRIKASA